MTSNDAERERLDADGPGWRRWGPPTSSRVAWEHLPARPRRPAPGVRRGGLFDANPALGDVIPFHEYFHGDTGKGLGASHQTGWTGRVADLIVRRGAARERYDIAGLARR